MKFNTISDAFNYWNGKTLEEIEARAAAIKVEAADPQADLSALNIEVDGLNQAKANKAEQRSAQPAQGLNPVTGMQFTPAANVQGDIYGSTEYRNAFFKNLLGQELTQVEKAVFNKAMAEKRADAFNTLSSSAAVIPTQTLNEVIKKARTMGGLINEVRAFAMPANIVVPVATPAAKAAWHVEGAKVDSEALTTVGITFGAYEILKVFSISAATRTMSIAAFESYITDELAACVMETIGYALINGTGSAQGTGLETGITWATTGTGKNHVQVAANASITYAKVVETVALLKRGYSQGAKWAMNNATLYNVFYGMLDGANRPIFIADPKDESIGKILGFPVVIDDNIADNVAYLGNFKYMAYNLPGGVAIESSRESSFKYGLVDYRALAVADCKPIVTEAFVKLSKAASNS